MKPGTRGMKGARYFFFQVADNAPMVLPWNAPIIAIISGLPEYFRANLMAHSTDSAPLLERNTLSIPLGAKRISFCSSSDRASL